jgi:hypothetical protein
MEKQSDTPKKSNTTKVVIHLSRPLGGGSSKIEADLDLDRGLVFAKVGKDRVGFSITSQIIWYWKYAA